MLPGKFGWEPMSLPDLISTPISINCMQPTLQKARSTVSCRMSCMPVTCLVQPPCIQQASEDLHTFCES